MPTAARISIARTLRTRARSSEVELDRQRPVRGAPIEKKPTPPVCITPAGFTQGAVTPVTALMHCGLVPVLELIVPKYSSSSRLVTLN